MGSFCRLIVRLCVCLIYVTVSYGELHRAKSNPSKLPVKSTKTPDSSYVAETLTEEETWEVNMLDIRYETWVYAIFASILVGLSGIFPLLVIPIEAGPSLKHGAAASRLKLLLSFAVGGLLGDVFLHLLPEAWEHLHSGVAHEDVHYAHMSLGLWVITGMLSFLIIEKIFAKEDEFEHLQDECSEAMEDEASAVEDLQVKSDLSCQPSHEHQTLLPGDNAENNHNRTKVSSTNNSAKHRSQTNGVKKNLGQQIHINNNFKQKHQKNSLNHVNGKNTELKDKFGGKSGRKVSASKDVSKESGIKVSGYLNLAANVIDNFTHGLAVAGGFLVNNKVGFITTIAILLHEIPHEVGDFAILLRSGFDRWKAAKAQLLTATGGMIGALTALTADSAQAAGEKTLWILPFTSGGFIYIALVTVVPDLMEEKHPRESTKQILSLLAGVAVMYLVSMVH